MADDTDALDEGESLSDAEPAALLDRARRGESAAAYELLARPVGIKTWREAVTLLRERDDVDLEVVAHRALRRPPEIVVALLDLAQAKATPQAAFVARAVSRLRDEPALITRATDVRREVLAGHDVPHRLVTGEPRDSLYLLVAHDLRDQPSLIDDVSRDQDAWPLVMGALDVEYQRLLELARTVRWKSGSYRHVLRHSLADLALIADHGGRTGELAYRLLQQEVDDPAVNEELVDLLPDSTRQRFLKWGIERDNAVAHPARTRFLFTQARKWPDDVDRAAVVEATRAVADPGAKVDGIVTAVVLKPAGGDLDRELADALVELPEAEARRLFHEVAVVAPSRLRFDLVTPSRLHGLVDASPELADIVAGRIADLVRTSSDPEVIGPLVHEVDRLGSSVPIADGVLYEVARAIVERPGSDLTVIGEGTPLWNASWRLARGAAFDRRPELVEALLRAGDTETKSSEVRRMLDEAPDMGSETLGAIARGLIDGRVEPRALSGSPADVLVSLARATSGALTRTEAEIEREEQLAAQGVEAAARVLLDRLAPIVAHAADRSAGNERLRADYERLLEGFTGETRAATEEPNSADAESSMDETIELELQGLGAVLHDADGSPVIDFRVPPDRNRAIRYLATLDQRYGRAADRERQQLGRLLPAYVDAIAKSGHAAALVTDLFERGPLARIAIGLSAPTRELLVQAAVEHGLEIKTQWLSDERLGSWLSSVTDGGSGVAVTETSDPLQEIMQTVRRADRGRAVDARLAALQGEAKVEFVKRAKDAIADIELVADGYFQFWRSLATLGVEQIAPIGTVIQRGDVSSDRHEVIGEATAERYVVRSPGIAVEGTTVVKAQLEEDTI